MLTDINGQKKKVACGPCIRGHRSSKCDHRDRVLVEVRKPGRPLSSCPHPSGSCSCERVVINYTIPKTSECACPSERAQTAPSVAGTSSRVQKTRGRKSTNTFTPLSLEKAIKASQNAEADSSSLLTSTPTNPSFSPSERSASNEASAPSSASSTPRILPSPSRKESTSSELRLSNLPSASSSWPATPSSQVISDCCKPRPTRHEPELVQLQQRGSCCSNKAREPPKPVQAKKSCCSGPSQPNQTDMMAHMSQQPNVGQNFAIYNPLQQQGRFLNPPYGAMNSTFNYNMPGNMDMSLPFGFSTPIYNHMASGYQQPAPMPNLPVHNRTNHAGGHGTEHNCQCGDGCSCFGCAAHPNNATMIEYIRLMHHFQSTGHFGTLPPPTYDVPSYPHHPGFGAESAQSMPFHPNMSSANFTPSHAPRQIPFQTTMSAMMGIPNTPMNMPGPWQPSSIQSPTQTPSSTEHQFFVGSDNAQERPLSLKTEESALSPAFSDSPSDGKDEDTPTLSPSSFFWQELVLPGCNDATGTCQCGDGCECVGCLTHGGHNGVPLEAPSIEPDPFSDFVPSNDLDANRSNHFMTGTLSENHT